MSSPHTPLQWLDFAVEVERGLLAKELFRCGRLGRVGNRESGWAWVLAAMAVPSAEEAQRIPQPGLGRRLPKTNARGPSSTAFGGGGLLLRCPSASLRGAPGCFARARGQGGGGCKPPPHSPKGARASPPLGGAS